MKNTAQIVFNAVLLLAVAALYALHFRSPSPTKPAVVAATAIAPAAAADTANAATPAASADLAAPTTPAAAAPAAGAIVYVESAKLLDGYQGAKDARRSFEAKAKGWQSQSQALNGSFRAAVEQYQKTAATLTAEQRAAAEQRLQAQQQQGAAELQKIQAQAQEAEAKLSQTVLGSIGKKVEAYGRANGYKLILISAPGGAVAYGEKGLDVTAPVLAYLNAGYKKK